MTQEPPLGQVQVLPQRGELVLFGPGELLGSDLERQKEGKMKIVEKCVKAY